MDLIHQLLNLAALFLWVNWINAWLSRPPARSTQSLFHTLQRTSPIRATCWILPAALLLLLALRPLLYHQIGSAMEWIPKLNLVVATVHFRSDFLVRMELFSIISFLQWLTAFYCGLFLLSALNGNAPDADVCQRIIRAHLGWIERWPALIKLLLPFVVGTVAWAGAAPVLSGEGLFPPLPTSASLWSKAAVIGLTTYLSWKYLLLAILAADLLFNYVYVGKHPAVEWLHATASRLLQPFIKLRIPKLGPAHALGIGLTILLAKAIASSLASLYEHLPG